VLRFACSDIYRRSVLIHSRTVPPETHRKLLRIVAVPAAGPVLVAPPALSFSTSTTEFVCGQCAVPLMQAQDEQVYGLVIHCVKCGAYNSTD
jgi:hypothetical protein